MRWSWIWKTSINPILYLYQKQQLNLLHEETRMYSNVEKHVVPSILHPTGDTKLLTKRDKGMDFDISNV